jgi:hypothetical protein
MTNTNTTSSNWIFGRTYVAGAYRVGLGLVGPKWIQVVYLADGNKALVAKLPADRKTIQSFRPLAGYGSPRKLALALLRDRKVGQMTKTARAILVRAKGIY